ncbi:MAG TPA: PilZ domain-containing protein [Candidatus Acidoferrales bacterium]|nr:PilZ domain-containing protein [Candidatus Acidoferrales bacterium]
MSSQERRRAPRKECLVPIRFRIVENGYNGPDAAVRLTDSGRGAMTHARFGMAEGQVQNLSERGVYFVCREKVAVGEEVELFFTLPAELTGRPPECVRCTARIVYAHPLERSPELMGAGVVVNRFEPLSRARNWAN